MPLFTISATGGYFTSPTTWVGGVPPSATSSDIRGLATSGPLSMGGLGNRNVGMWDLSAYRNTITMTGSATSIIINGATFAMHSGITSSIASNASNIYRFIVQIDDASYRGSNPTPGLRGVRLSMNGYRFKNTLYFQSNVNRQQYIMDEVIMDENSWLLLPANANSTIQSGTAGVRARVTFDPTNGRVATLQHSNHPNSITLSEYPQFVDLSFKNTTGSTNSVKLNSQTINSVVGAGINVIFDGGSLVDDPAAYVGFALGTNCSIEYISGTISPPQVGFILSRVGTSFIGNTVSVKTSGIDWDVFSIVNTNSGQDSSVITPNTFLFNNDFKAKNLILSSGAVNSTFNIGTSQSFVVDNLLLSSFRPIQVSNSSTPTTKWSQTLLGLYGGATYSFGRIISGGKNLPYGIPTGGENSIYATGSGKATINLTNASVTTGTDYTNIDVVGAKIYTIDSIFTNTTGIELDLPTGGTGSSGGGGSFVFIT